MLLVHLFVCFVRVSFCHFYLPLGVGCWVQFVIWHSLDFSVNFFFFINLILAAQFCHKSMQNRFCLVSTFGFLFAALAHHLIIN